MTDRTYTVQVSESDVSALKVWLERPAEGRVAAKSVAASIIRQATTERES